MSRRGERRSGSAAALALLLASCTTAPPPLEDRLTISVVGTNDIHGAFMPRANQGGLVTISGYVDALRAARAADSGAVLLIDAGDMWQGTLESNLVEGKSVVEAFNAMGYDAATIGNHEFDFGPAGSAAIPREAGDDPRGALKQRALEMEFPLLSSNLIVSRTGEHVDWPNVMPSVMLEVQGVRVGVIGVITRGAPATTIKANIAGLEIEPLADAITREAHALRIDGADLVVVAAHAGGRCEEFSDPYDTSSCFMAGEIMRVASAVPEGLVDHIVAGHVHERIAHIVNGISITSGHSGGAIFGRTDFEFDRSSGILVGRRVFPPQVPCPWVSNATGECAWDRSGDVSRPNYAGYTVEPNHAVFDVSNRAVAYAEAIKNEPLGPILETPITTAGNPESALGNLFVDAVLAGVDGDIAIHNVTGGIRANLGEGPVTFGDVYEVMPFDNGVVVLDLSGAELRRVMAAQAHKHRRRAGIAGVRVTIRCENDEMIIDMVLNHGRVIADDDRVRLIANDFLALGGDDILTPVMPDEGFEYDDGLPVTRDVLVDWFRTAPDRLSASDFSSHGQPRWNVPADLPPTCSL
ncbi:MAG: bifunctional metallophosphatase/5'-nucleotidase [Woeseiaceae bacterium]